ncbi:cupin domain-containing protein [Shewanella eurypsychrophilus]|uniref:Cupin domain-containing protein n=1 Tax=Shewanella eurypsychrophilus TaxID=2593656 RepID=A0ABX6V3V5_9GAMM|nr:MULTISPECIES: cupin domain-containing protein [Shewanella]QFU21951.1 cupin domain-containing protein [Shewanella sp. YLB-09]QPG57240.1 cupin domain-containing protein [Shewanella eurypsychrophilus]
MLKLCWLVFLLGSFSVSAATSKDLIKSTESWDGNKLPAYSLTQPEVTIKEIVIASGEELPWHQHPVINAGILLSGELMVYTRDGKQKNLKAGDTLIELVNTSHYGKNISEEPAKIVVFYLAEQGDKVTVLDHKH